MSVFIVSCDHLSRSRSCLAFDLREARKVETACPGSCFSPCNSVKCACIVCWFTQCLVNIYSSVKDPWAAPKLEYRILEMSVPRHSWRSFAPSWSSPNLFLNCLNVYTKYSYSSGSSILPDRLNFGLLVLSACVCMLQYVLHVLSHVLRGVVAV